MSQQADLAVSFNQLFGRFPIIFLSRWLLLVAAEGIVKTETKRVAV